MDEVWLIIERRTREIMAFSSEELLMQYFQELYPEKKSLRLMSEGTYFEHYSLVNHNTHVGWTNIYRVELDTGEEVSIWY
jgi:hypothetical protein